MDHAKQILRGNGIADKFFILFIPHFVGYNTDPLYAQILCQTFDIAVGLNAAGTGFDDHDE
ncbi:MAG: hypothetical protein IIV03_02670, partial [Clostridia bacterium]|nr:hypothetical protein [Clostridia bacterium]